jgi:hypothetical protein
MDGIEGAAAPVAASEELRAHENGEAATTVIRPHCLKVEACEAKGPGHCRRCAATEQNKCPDRRAKTSAAMLARYQDPTYRAEHRRRTLAGVAAESEDVREARRRNGREVGSKNIEATRPPEVRARAGLSISATKMAGVPVPQRDEYRRLVRGGYASAAEAKRILAEEAAARARRDVAEVLQKQRARAAREKAQAY